MQVFFLVLFSQALRKGSKLPVEQFLSFPATPQMQAEGPVLHTLNNYLEFEQCHWFDRLFSFFLDSKEDWWSLKWCHFQFILPERWKGLYQSAARTRHEPAWSAAEDERVQLKRWSCTAADTKHDTSLKWVPVTPSDGFSLNILSSCKFVCFPSGCGKYSWVLMLRSGIEILFLPQEF